MSFRMVYWEPVTGETPMQMCNRYEENRRGIAMNGPVFPIKESTRQFAQLFNERRRERGTEGHAA